jgi:hypothetical protein
VIEIGIGIVIEIRIGDWSFVGVCFGLWLFVGV